MSASPSPFNKKNPFPARLAVHRRLNGEGSAKDTRHFEFDLEGSGLDYSPGDACAVIPSNWPELVDEIIAALDCDGAEPVPSAKGDARIPLREALLRDYQITKPPRGLLEAIVEKTGDPELRRLLDPANKAELDSHLREREIIDVLAEHHRAVFDPEEFIGHLRKMTPRLYSISSSLRAHPGSVHLTVAVLAYHSNGRERKGVCSTFLAERVAADTPVPIFMHHNKAFSLPEDPAAPIVMVGPGTGVAPFRAFLEERRAAGSTGRNWLFFGDQHAKTDFLYGDEFEAWRKDGLLTRLDLAFSRDQAAKVYVQHRMMESAKELYDWLEAGAYFYVCGDASRMAADVHSALKEAIQAGGGKSADEAEAYVKGLQTHKRYRRDVY